MTRETRISTSSHEYVPVVTFERIAIAATIAVAVAVAVAIDLLLLLPLLVQCQCNVSKPMPKLKWLCDGVVLPLHN